MATKTGIVTINGIQAIECDSDPSIGGLVAAIGSYASATDGSGIFYKSASSNTAWTQVIMPSTIPTRITNLENNEYKVTYYEIISGASGSLTVPTGATINAGEFGLSGNAILSKIDGSNKPTFESPKTAGGVVVTSSLNVSTGAWVASGVYTDASVALIYSIKIKAINYGNLTYANIIETVELTDFPISQTITNGVTDKVPSQNAVYDALAYKENFSNKTSTIIGNETDVDKYTNTKSVADYVNLFVGSGSTTDLGVVISQKNIPPGSPVIGDAYLVGTVPTGTWVGKNNKIATWNGAIWVYTNPSINSTVFITETLTTLRYNGTSWVAFQGTAILQNGNSLGVAMSIGTKDNFDLNFKRNNVVQWSINSLGWLTRTTSGKTTSLNDGFANFSDSSTAGFPGIQFTQTVTNNRISILGRWGQTGGGNFVGTAIGSADYLQISNGGSSSNTYPIMIRGSIIHNFIGHTGTNIATRLDNVGLRIGTMADIHTANTNLFDLKGKFHHDVNHNVVVGSDALATTATDGFFYIPTCAGTPTGVPTTKTGRIPMVYDSTNNKFYMYNSGWKSVTLT